MPLGPQREENRLAARRRAACDAASLGGEASGGETGGEGAEEGVEEGTEGAEGAEDGVGTGTGEGPFPKELHTLVRLFRVTGDVAPVCGLPS